MRSFDNAARRATCADCQRPLRTCLCTWIRATDNRLPLLVLQHPHEVGHAKGSASLLRLSLQRCQLEVGEAFDRATLAAWLGPQAVLLYPGAGGTELAALPQRLVLLDGTWRNTRKLLHMNPLLQQLPRIALAAPPPSLYMIRKAQQPQQRSTLEAACHALGAIENRPSHYAPLLLAFDGWVRSQAHGAGGSVTPS